MDAFTLWIVGLVIGALSLAAVGLYLAVQPPPCESCGAPMVTVADDLVRAFPPVRQREFCCPRCGSSYTPRPTLDMLD